MTYMAGQLALNRNSIDGLKGQYGRLGGWAETVESAHFRMRKWPKAKPG